MDDVFLVSSCFRISCKDDPLMIPWKSTWYHPIPSKVQFFVLSSTLDKILTVDQLAQKGFPIPNIYHLLYEDADSISHLLIHCKLLMEVWHSMLGRFRQCWVGL